MKGLNYLSGETVNPGDRITYHGEEGCVEFVVTGQTEDPELKYYAKEFPGGGFMIEAAGFGRVFLTADDIDEDLEFVSRGDRSQG